MDMFVYFCLRYAFPLSEFLRLMVLRTYLLSTPPRIDALRHSGGANLRCTSATDTLYLDVELSRERRPGTEQKTSTGVAPKIPSLDTFIMLWSRALMPKKENGVKLAC